jgi:hypothetical protein
MFKYIVLLVFIWMSINAQVKKTFDHSTFETLLKKYVSEEGWVNYEKFRGNEKFEQYLENIAKANVENLSDAGKLAFYINAYNAFVIKNVNNHLLLSSPLDVEGFFKNIKFEIAGESLTLDEIEHQRAAQYAPILMHFGLVCAAKSCPKLITTAYTEENVYKLLDENGFAFLNDSDKNRINKENKILYLSEIFKWFRSTFEGQYGSLKETVANFSNKDEKEFLLNNDMEIVFLKYNWELNSQK